MFKFNYLIYDSMKKILKNISIKEFEEEYGMIYGAFELLINDQMYNYIVRYKDQKFCDEKEKEEFDDLFELQDIISLWIIIFLKICIELKRKDYVAIMDIESKNWIEFKRINNELYISQIEEEKVKSKITSLHIVKVYNKFYDEDKNKNIFFKEEKINFEEFISGIQITAKRFIKEIKEINPVLLKSKEVSSIIKKYNILISKEYLAEENQNYESFK